MGGLGSEQSRDLPTLRYYAQHVPDHVGSGLGGTNLHLSHFLSLLKPGARILDLGCGTGRDAAAMAAAGFDVDAADGVPEMAKLAETRLGKAVSTMCFDELSAVDEYDAVWASACLPHVPRPGLVHILARILQALKPGGLHFASFKAGVIDDRDPDGRYFNFMTFRQLLVAYGSSGNWEQVWVSEYDGGAYPGKRGPWLAVIMRRPA